MTLRRAWLALGWLWIAAVFWLSLTPHPPAPFTFHWADKMEHALAYGALMLWFCQIPFMRIRLAGALVAMGIGIEILQGMTGYRQFEYFDMLANASGVMLGWLLALTPLGSALIFLERYVKH